MWNNITIFRKFNIFLVNIGDNLNITSKGLLSEGSKYKNPSFIPTIHSISIDDPEGLDYIIDTSVIKVRENIYKIGSVSDQKVKCVIKLLVYES